MTSQLATMLASGCDLCAGLEAMSKQQPKPYLKQVVTELHDNVKAGQAFSQALSRHPDIFKPIFVTMVRAGESAGLLKSMLSTLQGMIRNQLRITTSIRSALMYPCILIGVAITAIIVMTTFVLPRFAQVFKSSGVPLPTSTRIVIIGTAEFVGSRILPLFGGLPWLLISSFPLYPHPARRQTHAARLSSSKSHSWAPPSASATSSAPSRPSACSSARGFPSPKPSF